MRFVIVLEKLGYTNFECNLLGIHEFSHVHCQFPDRKSQYLDESVMTHRIVPLMYLIRLEVLFYHLTLLYTLSLARPWHEFPDPIRYYYKKYIQKINEVYKVRALVGNLKFSCGEKYGRFLVQMVLQPSGLEFFKARTIF